MQPLTEILERFNRKERHWLIRDALGPPAAKLDKSFLERDIDLVIASGTTLVMVEAKGVGTWSGGALDEKVARLRSMTGDLISDDGTAGNFAVHFILYSPQIKEKPNSSQWPAWTKSGDNPFVMQLHVAPSKEPFLKVERCDATSRTNVNGQHWRVLENNIANRLPKLGGAGFNMSDNSSSD